LPLCRHRSSFVLLPPPPTSPLFPYTTLFRSNRCSPGRSWQNLSPRVGLVGVLVGCPVPAQPSPQRRHAVRGGASGRRLTAAGQLGDVRVGEPAQVAVCHAEPLPGGQRRDGGPDRVAAGLVVVMS